MGVKVRRGGKYELVQNDNTGYYGRNDAGDRHTLIPKTWGKAVGFVGSNSKEYTFSDRVHGMRTITAESFDDALRIAESLGYTRDDYIQRRGK